MTPAEVFPLGQFIADELEARGWTVRECAERMGGDVDMWHFTIELYLCQAHKDSEGHSIRDVVCGTETAAALERAFGVSAETWLNLDRAYHAHKPTR